MKIHLKHENSSNDCACLFVFMTKVVSVINLFAKVQLMKGSYIPIR